MKKKTKNTDENLNAGNQVIASLTRISEAITSDLYLDDILRLIVNVTAEAMKSKICSLMLIDKSKNELAVKATQSVSDRYNKKPNVKLGEGIAGRVAKEGIPITISDVRKDERYLSRDIAKKENLCSLLSVPLIFKNKTIGALNAYTAEPHVFTKNEINILKSIANQLSLIHI